MTVTGPRGLPVVGVGIAFNRDALGYLEGVWREHGDLSRFKLGPYDVWMAVHPEHLRQILHTHHARYHKSPEYAELEPAVGKGLLTSEDQLWRRNRRLAQPAFRRSSLDRYAEQMSGETERMLQAWRPGPLQLAPAMTELTLRIVSRTLFSTELGGEIDELSEAVDILISTVNARMLSVVKAPISWPTPANIRFRRAKQLVDGRLAAFVAFRREHGDSGDLLSMLLFATDPDTGDVLSDVQLRDELVTLFAAGHETTSTALVWTLSLLQQHPRWEEAAAEEARSVLGGRIATAGDALPLLDRIVMESLRLRPPAWAIGRTPIQPDNLDGHDLPEGALVLLPTWLTQKHPDFWEDPERFDPDRWLPERAEGRHRFAWLPFGGGPRVCIGRAFARMELRIVLGSILARWRVEVPEIPAADPAVTLRPIGPVPVRLHAR